MSHTVNFMMIAAGALCLLSLVTSLLGVCCSFSRRLWVWAIALPGFALLVAYFGLTRLSVKMSKTVNNQLQWKIDSDWFFTAALILAIICLGVALWNNRARLFRSKPVSVG